jgi:hypothetical protein
MFKPYRNAPKLSPNLAKLSCMMLRYVMLASKSAILSASSANCFSSASSGVALSRCAELENDPRNDEREGGRNGVRGRGVDGRERVCDDGRRVRGTDGGSVVGVCDILIFSELTAASFLERWRPTKEKCQGRQFCCFCFSFLFDITCEKQSVPTKSKLPVYRGVAESVASPYKPDYSVDDATFYCSDPPKSHSFRIPLC